ncbi:SOS response-associated peptidase [Patescibacteria group bacterium]|nr:SOS response-associated peptidase [Patescibacteria group bacterium]
MCGRFTLKALPDELERRFGIRIALGSYKLKNNIAPSEMIPVIPTGDPSEFVWMRWGIRPGWWSGSKVGIINVRSESLRTKQVFNRMFNEQRCIIPADGFYEWRNEGGKKVPYLITKNQQLFAFAGVWERDREGLSVAIITCEPNMPVRKIHYRMPCILDTISESTWLNEGTTQEGLLNLLKPMSDNLTTVNQCKVLL